jgi:putative ABC transport system permease protein
MSRFRFVLAMAWRESRASRRTLLLLLASVSVGVAALVAIQSFGDSVRSEVRRQARALLGADLSLASGAPFSPKAEALLEQLARTARAAAPVARVTTFGAMARVPERARVRLVQVMAVEPGYPFYGDVVTQPPGQWGKLSDNACLVDQALLIGLDAGVGDSLAIGEARFRIRGTVLNMPGDVSVRTSLGPRVFIPRAAAEATRLLGFGARARHEAFLALPESAVPENLVARFRPPLAAERVTLRTVAEDQLRLDRSLGRLARFLGLVSFIALLLGGIGVSSAVSVLIRRRLETVAVLRCLGASSRRVLAVYVAQAVAVGALGSASGVLLGSAVQLALPWVLQQFLPVQVAPAVSGRALLFGLLIGIWTSAAFALLPLLTVRRVSPLLALRREFEPPRRSPVDRARALALFALAASVAGMAVLQAEDVRLGLGFAGGIGVALLVLWLTAAALRRFLRRHVSSALPYVWRQGVANLHRPANQTLAVVLSLGFGVFLLGTLVVLQHNLLRDLRIDGGGSRPNLVLLDIQRDQLAAVESLLRASGTQPSAAVPIVSMRIASLKGVPSSQLLAQAAAGARGVPPPWLLRREYRSTYRDRVSDSETVVAGSFWRPGAGSAPASGRVPVSLDAEVANDLGVRVGDEIVWDIQGVPLASEVACLREIQWARFEPNFFAVFPEGPLLEAPQTFVTLARVEDAAARARLERSIVERFPNLSTIDVAEVQRAIEDITNRVAWAVRFMALFSVAAGLVVLVGAIATSQKQRLRESALLKALGGTRRQISQVILAEYVSLGVLAALVGLLLAAAGGSALLRYVFESAIVLPAPPLLVLGGLVVLVTAGFGALASAEVFRKTSLEVLRAE